ncbi:MAG: PTS sugar transporter subunit IIA [Chloroflexota bacterium]
MRLEEIITEKSIDLELEAKSKSEAIEKLVDVLLENERIVEKEPFLQNVLEREKTESTDMGIGVAIPHGISDAVAQPSVVIGRLKDPFYWEEDEELQEEPIFAVFLLASSKNIQGNDHLEMISKIATLLIDDDFKHTLRTASSKTILLNAIQSHLGEM